jgi:GNAT superfamily N-acetyltransferase
VIVHRAESELDASFRAQVARLHVAAFGSLDAHDPALRPETFVLIEDDVVVAAADVLSKTVEHANAMWDASGLSAVVTDPGRRRAGHGEAVSRAAIAWAESRGADLVIFSCDTPLRGFYERCGCRVLLSTVLIGGTPDDPLRTDEFDKVVLARFFTARAVAASGVFEDCEVALYPGTVDRLW